MDYLLPNPVKSRLLRFALAKTGFLDTDALDLDKLNFSLGRNTNAEFRDVGFRIEKLSALLKLPPSIRLLAARAVLVRLSITSDLSITAEVDGIEVHASMEESEVQKKDERLPESLRTPQHRKTPRRWRSPSAHDPGGQALYGFDDGDRAVPTAQDLAKSFLDEEPAEERQELAANLMSQSRHIDESIISDSSNEEMGTGNGLGLPVFMAGIIQGIIDRAQIRVSNVSLRIDTNFRPKSSSLSDPSVPIGFTFGIAAINVNAVNSRENALGDRTLTASAYVGRRHISLADINLDMLFEAPKSAHSSPVPTHVQSRSPEQRSGESGTTESPSLDLSQATLPSVNPGESAERSSFVSTTPTQEQSAPLFLSPTVSPGSVGTTARSRFADAEEKCSSASPVSADESDIQAGEDSYSYTSRRSQSSSEIEQPLYDNAEESQILYASIVDFQSSHGSASGSLPDLDLPLVATSTSTSKNGSGSGSGELRALSTAMSSLTRPQLRTESHETERHDSPKSPAEADNGMTESVIMGETMYLSATSEDLTPSAGDANEFEPINTASEYFPPSPDHRRPPGYFPEDSYTEDLSQSTPTVRSTNMEAGPDAGTNTARAPEPSNSSRGSPEVGQDSCDGSDLPRVRKRLLSLDTVEMWLPATNQTSSEGVSMSQSIVSNRSPQSSMPASSFSPDMPGTFSHYADMGASRRLQASFMPEQPPTFGFESTTSSANSDLDIDVGDITIQADVHTLQLISQLTALASYDTAEKDSSSPPAKPGSQPMQSFSPRVSFRVKSLRLSLLDRVPENLVQSGSPASCTRLAKSKTMVHLHGRDITLGLTSHSATPDITFGIRRLTAGSGAKDFLSFMKSASNQHDRSPDILVKVQRSRVTLQNMPVTDVRAWLQPIHVDLDLPALDEALESFGGLSGVMEMSASVLSSGTDPATVPPSPRRRGVHFHEDVKKPASTEPSPELKLNLTLQGANLAVISHSCALELQSSAVKLSVRSNYIVAVVGSVILSEGLAPGQRNTSRFHVQMKDLKLEYLPSPDDKDLERLLSLITPSKDKYENDDDILLDTLLRQRRKGAVLRVRLGAVRADVKCWTFTTDLQSLGDELTKLSAVTKYLPEDDRPGLLVLPRIVDAHARVPINDHFGLLEISLREIHIAQIGLPALMAISIGSIRAGALGGADIVHELRPAEQLPMVMMRMVGDEVEPTTKIKLFNLCVEYSVDTVTALTGSDAPIETEKVVSEIAASILNVAALEIEHPPLSPSHQSESSTRPAKKIALDVLLHECALGLKPHDSAAKGVLVLSDTKLSTVVPPDDNFSATLELRKASLHIIDEEAGKPETTVLSPHLALGTDRLSSHLASMGFVGVSSIMSAKAILSVTENTTTEERFVDVEVRDELFVLETCADSTQTLISILNGLAPPAPPNNTPQFRTEVMSIGDMMASFSGDAFEKPPEPPSTLFDVDEEPPLSEMDNLLQESAMADSVYLPNNFEQGEELDWSPEQGSVPSLLDEDEEFEFMDPPNKKRLSNNALEYDLREQCSAQLCENAKLLSSTKHHYNPRTTSSESSSKTRDTVLGSPHRLATPATPFPAYKMAQQNEPYPFQVRVRDVHIIWNLFDGYDWERTRIAIAEAVEEVEQKLEQRKQRRRRSADPEEEEDSVIGDCLFNSIYIGVPNNRDAGDLRRQISRGIDDLVSESESYATSGTSRPTQYSGSRQSRQPVRPRKVLRLMRSKAHKIAFELKGVSVDLSLHPPGSGEVQSSVDVRLREFEIFDNVPTSTWRKFLTYYHDNENRRELMKPMIHLELLNIRPVLELAATEISLRVSVLPLRLHVDQDALDFITRFFEFKSDSSVTQPPADPPFIQRIEVNTVKLCLDYKPKKVDYAGIRSGHTGEFKNFVILDAANIKLKHAIVYGIKGFDTLHPTLSDIWTPDVIRNQLPGVLAGLGPLRSLVSLGAGVRDVVAIPVREYKKDGRLFRSVQKGAFQFAKTTTAELARLGAKLATGTHAALSGLEETLVGAQDRSEEGDDYEERRLVSNYADQPLGVLQGLGSARRHFERDLLTAKDAIIAVQGEMVDAGSAAGVARAVAKYAPTIVLRPVIGASRAVGQTFMGVTNQVDTANVRRNEDKYKPR